MAKNTGEASDGRPAASYKHSIFGPWYSNLAEDVFPGYLPSPDLRIDTIRLYAPITKVGEAEKEALRALGFYIIALRDNRRYLTGYILHRDFRFQGETLPLPATAVELSRIVAASPVLLSLVVARIDLAVSWLVFDPAQAWQRIVADADLPNARRFFREDWSTVYFVSHRGRHIGDPEPPDDEAPGHKAVTIGVYTALAKAEHRPWAGPDRNHIETRMTVKVEGRFGRAYLYGKYKSSPALSRVLAGFDDLRHAFQRKVRPLIEGRGDPFLPGGFCRDLAAIADLAKLGN